MAGDQRLDAIVCTHIALAGAGMRGACDRSTEGVEIGRSVERRREVGSSRDDIVVSDGRYTQPLNACKESHDDVQIFWENGNPVKVVNLTTKEEATSPANVLKMLNRLGGATRAPPLPWLRSSVDGMLS